MMLLDFILEFTCKYETCLNCVKQRLTGGQDGHIGAYNCSQVNPGGPDQLLARSGSSSSK